LQVRRAYEQLKKAGFDPWLDENDLLPGQNWEEEIPRALKASAAVLVFLSKTSVSKRGYVQREFRIAFDTLQEIPHGQVFVIPVKLDDCEVPELFRSLHWAKAGGEGTNLTQVISSLRRQVFGKSERKVPSLPTHADPPNIALGRYDRLRGLESKVQVCMKCRLGADRKRPAFARGGPVAAVMFLGEGPGASDDLTGVPFTGPAGELLDRMISAIGLSPDDVYLSNVIKCRAPGNRAPEPDELDACRSHWDQQIQLVAPKVLVTLGSVASQTVFETTESMSVLRGKWKAYKTIPTMPIYHPAFLLRNLEAKRDAWNDLKSVRQRLRMGTG